MPKLSKKLIKNKNSVENKGKRKRKSQKKVNRKKYTHKKRGGASPSQYLFNNSRHRTAQERRMQRKINTLERERELLKQRRTMLTFNPTEGNFIGNNNKNDAYAPIQPGTTQFVYNDTTFEDWSSFVESESFTKWLKSEEGQKWFESDEGQEWLKSKEGQKYFASLTEDK